MLYVPLALLLSGAFRPYDVVLGKTCEPSNYICSGRCPSVPEGLRLPESVAICMKDSETGACICWLHNPSSQLDSLFLCDATVNNSRSQVLCQTPTHCFPPGPSPSCLVIPLCHCLLQDERSVGLDFGQWRPVRAILKTVERPTSQDYDSVPLEKSSGQIREFSLKHLLFLLGFVIAPLFCWCLLNFFHEGKCRKKTPRTPESAPMPTARAATVDHHTSDEETTQSRPRSPNDETNPRRSPHETLVQVEVMARPEPSGTMAKSESPPPYCEAPEQEIPAEELGPPPSYEDAMQGVDAGVRRLWQTVFIEESPEDAS